MSLRYHKHDRIARTSFAAGDRMFILSRPVAQHTGENRHQGLPPEQSRAGCIYRAQVENSSDKHAVILPEIAVAFGDLDQIRMCHIPI
jgi:hypothetical protein